MEDCVNNINNEAWQVIRRLPAFRYTKEPVDTVADLYAKYPAGNDDGVFCFVKNENTFYRFYVRKRIWAPIGGYTAFEVWVQQPGNEGKTEEDFLLWLKKEALEAADTANEAAENANTAADAADTAAHAANTAAGNAVTAANTANAAAVTADEATENANAATDAAVAAAEYATTQGDYAAEIPSRVLALEQNKVDGGYSEEGLLFLTSGGEVIGDPIPVGSGSGGGSGGGGGSILRLINRGNASIGVPKGQTALLQYTFTSVDSETQESTGSGTAVYFVGSARVHTQVVEQGDIDFNITPYLADRKNTVRVSVTDSYGAARSLNISIEVINLQISSTFDDSLIYNSEISFPYTPVGAGEKTIHFILDGAELDSVATTSSDRQLYQTLPALTHGSHILEVYASMEYGGVTVESNHLRFGIIYDAGEDEIIVSSTFNQQTAEQYEILVIKYSVYNPSSLTTAIRLMADDKVVSEQTVDRTRQTWSYRIPGYGALSLKIVAFYASKQFDLDVTKSDIDSEAETENLELYLSSDGRSNNESYRDIWRYEDIYAELNGFNFKTNGWVADDNNVTTLRISQGASVYIPFKPFASDFKQTGKTIEIEFRVRNVEDFSTVVISCFSGERGFKITPNNILFKSDLSSVSAKFREDQLIRVSFVIESRLKNRIIYTYLNGIASGAIQYVTNDDFAQVSPVGISIGSKECTIDVYTIRSYGADLNQYQILGNHIADTALISEKLAIYDRNQVYDSSGDIVYSLLVGQLPCMIITGELPTYKGDKKTVALAFENRQNPEKSFAAENVQIDVQGTSSQYYPRKNFKNKSRNGFVMTESGTHEDGYALRAGSIPVDTFCEKADFAESSGTHNTGMAKYIDQVMRKLKYLTPPQKTDASVRTTVDGYPIAIFHREDSLKPTYFVGKYNFNNDKSTQETFGFSGADECWEFLNNTSDRSLFRSDDFSGTEWTKDFEGRYPDGYDNPANLQILYSWIVSCIGKPSKFKNEAAQHFNTDNLLSYYLITELFGMVDQRAKNQFLTSWGNEGSGEYKWYFIFYDNDTCLGINNEGANVFGYNIEDTDTLGDGHVWNGWDSELWKLVKAAYTSELAKMYGDMRQSGALSYDSAIAVLNGEQAAKWCEVVYNMDGQYKYIQPLIAGTGDYLYAMQGSRTDHRIWWLSNRFFYMDSKYNAGDFLNDFVTMRLYTPSQWGGVAPNWDFALTLYKDSYVRVKYGSYILEQRGQSGQTINIQAPDIQFNDTETIIYGISTIKGIGDLSGKYPGTVDISNAKGLVELLIGSALPGYSNRNLSHVSVENNKMLRVVDIQNCPEYTEPLDLSGCDNIEEVRALGSSISTVVLPQAGILNRMELPATISNLTLKSQLMLNSENLILESIENITTLVLENMNSMEQLDLVKSLLNIEPLKLNRVRLIDVDMADADLSVLLRLASLKGIDESGFDTDRSVITGRFYAGAAMESDIANCRAMYPGLEIDVSTELEDPTTTFEFVSSQDRQLNYVSFDANLPFTKIDDTHYSIKASAGTVITFTFEAENHEGYAGTYEVTYTRTRLYSMIYVPVRPVVFKNYANQEPLEGVELYVDNETYISDIDGTVYIRKREAFTTTARLEGFGAATFSLNESSTDTNPVTVPVYPYVDVKFVVKNTGVFFNYGSLQQGATVIFNGETKTTDSNGEATFRAHYGKYDYEAFLHEDKKTTGELTVVTSDMTQNTNVAVRIDDIKPVPDGSMMLHVSHSYTNITISYTSDSAFTIDWGDGVTQTLEAGTTAIQHNYPTNNTTHLIKLIDCEGVSGFRVTYNGYIAALWTIGNSMLVPYSFEDDTYLVYVGRDIFRNAVTKTDLTSFFRNCGQLKWIEDGVFDGLVNVTAIIHLLSYTALESLPANCFADMVNLQKVDSCLIRTPVKVFDNDLFRYHRQINSISSLFYENKIVEYIGRGILPVETDQPITNTSTVFYNCEKLKTVYIPACIANFGLSFMAGCKSLQYIEMESETPPSLSSNAFDGTNSTFVIYVPNAAVDAYKGATNWNAYAERILPVSQKPA